MPLAHFLGQPAEADGFGEGGPVTRRRIQPKPALELETVSLRLPAQLVRAIDQYAKFLGGSTDRTYVITQSIELALAQDRDFARTLAVPLTGRVAGPSRGNA
jgi:hypothetical protein